MNRYVSLYNGRDFDALREILSPDLRILDHRPVGWGALEGRETFIEMLGAAIELAPDAHLSAEPLALGTRAMVGRLPLRGHLAAGGGEFELPLLLLVVFDDEYTTTEFELFGEGEEAAALVRFEEIGAQTEHERLWARVCRTRNARDWDGLRACYLEEHEQIDHRTLGWEVLRGAEAMVDMFRSWDDVAPDVELWFEVLAVEGEHGVAHMGGRGHAAEGGGGWSTSSPRSRRSATAGTCAASCSTPVRGRLRWRALPSFVRPTPPLAPPPRRVSSWSATSARSRRGTGRRSSRPSRRISSSSTIGSSAGASSRGSTRISRSSGARSSSCPTSRPRPS